MASLVRKIVAIDESLCDGCGDCLPSCGEGAIALVAGKARVASDALCDGLGACIGHCPRGAISVVEREAVPFDLAHAHEHGAPLAPAAPARPRLTVVPDAGPEQASCAVGQAGSRRWPVQLALVSPDASHLRGADLLVSADCVPVAFPRFHERLLAGRAVVMGCPKLDDVPAAARRLEAIFRTAGPRSVTVARMEVPCCCGISVVARRALAGAGLAVPVRDVVIGVGGEVRGE
ncbi:MAG TPA: 4Fe-4S dicluster domain-containing protein [Anaeromyxobacteraceae bacterium]|nr:4Fe-4S dicluster domain-containing protein [Anaeromyxobacteraceae bacterium]